MVNGSAGLEFSYESSAATVHLSPMEDAVIGSVYCKGTADADVQPCPSLE